MTEYKDFSNTVQREYEEVGRTLRQDMKCDRSESVSQMPNQHVMYLECNECWFVGVCIITPPNENHAFRPVAAPRGLKLLVRGMGYAHRYLCRHRLFDRFIPYLSYYSCVS